MFVLSALVGLLDRDSRVFPWAFAAMLVLLGLTALGGSLLLLWPSVCAPSRACPQCGSPERANAGVLRRTNNLWLSHLGGWLIGSLWGASRERQVRCIQCDALYLTATRGTRIAGVLLWVFLLMSLIGAAIDYFK